MFDSVWVLDQAPSSRLTRAELAAGVLGAHLVTLAALVAAQSWRIDPVPLPSLVAPPLSEIVPFVFEDQPAPARPAPPRPVAQALPTPAPVIVAAAAPPQQLADAAIPDASSAATPVALVAAGTGAQTGDPAGPIGIGNGPGGQDEETIVVWNQALVRPVVVHRVDPVYPRLAQLQHRNGIVHLRAQISSAGEVRGLELVDASPAGFGFEESALDAVRQWRFRPATTKDGRAVAVLYLLQVTFTVQ